MDIDGKKVLVTGGNSFLGKSLVPLLEEKGAEPISFSSRDYNLTKEKDVERLFSRFNPAIVIHLAVDCGGFKYKTKNPGSIFYNNILMNSFVQEYSRISEVEKFVGVGSYNAYPESANSPLKEEDLWLGHPNEPNYSYGLVKRIMALQSQLYRQQYGFNALHLMPANLYGPNYTLEPKSIRIIPLLIKKMIEAKNDNKEEIELVGTKDAFREFLYVGDCAEAIILATERYNKTDPVNIGYGKAIRMDDLGEKIKEATSFLGVIKWQESYIDGQPERILDTSRAEIEFGFKAKTSLGEGLKKTVAWYLSHKAVL